MRTLTSQVLTILWSLIGLVGCARPGLSDLRVNNDGAIELRVMSFNIEWGGARISFEKVVEAIQLAKADIVGIQEAEGNLQRLARDLGWHYDLPNYLISRYPLIDPPAANGKYAYVELRPGKVVAIANVHLPSDPYGPDAVREDATPEEVLEIEQLTRMPAIAASLAPLSELVAQGIPVFITGDFNAPAHTDWTEATVGARKFMYYPLAWPVSKAVAIAGFRDSWRVLYPDPLKHPGLTWWAGRPPLPDYAPDEKDAEDRIDFIWFAGPAEARTSKILGERDGAEVAIGLTPWPSDHRALVTEFQVTPADMPELVTTDKRVYEAGTAVDIIFNSGNEATLNVINKDNTVTLAAKRVYPGQGKWQLPASQLVPAYYQVRMQDPNSKVDLGRDFWVLAADAMPVVEVVGASFTAGEGINVRWRNAPGNRNDYLAAYFLNVDTGYDNGLARTYVDALPEGEKRLDETTSTLGWPLQPGEYVIRLVKDDGYDVLAESAPFIVNPRSLLPHDLLTFNDGRRPVAALFAAYQTLLDQGWQQDLVAYSQPDGTKTALPIIALRSPNTGPALWLMTGIHGEEPAGPNAVATAIDDIAALGERYPVVLLPLLNPHGYARNWRYLNMPIYSVTTDGQSVGDSSHLLPDLTNPGQARATASSMEANAITQYVLDMLENYPPRYSIDLHEDNLINEGYVYSQGEAGANDALAAEAVLILRENNIGIKMSGQTRFDEDIINGIIGPVTDSSIDELMSSKTIIVDDRSEPGPATKTVLVFETPAGNLTLAQRVNAHVALLRRLTLLIGAGEVR